MEERQIKQRDVAGSLLRAAASEIKSESEQQELAALIGRYDFQAALSALEEAASMQQVTLEFWWHLKKVAEVLGLSERRKQLQVKYQDCRRA